MSTIMGGTWYSVAKATPNIDANVVDVVQGSINVRWGSIG